MSDRDEWRDAVRDLTEADRAQITPYYRRAPGQIGEPDDDAYGNDNSDDDYGEEE